VNRSFEKARSRTDQPTTHGPLLTRPSLDGQVVVLTGGASGIGAATVRLLHSKGAKVIFGDVNAAGAEEVIKATSSDSVHFQKCDASNYGDNLALFKMALQKYGRVNHAVANAGLIEQGH
jgi:NAD(P)-dependent dehydrogenase (short-subunit alcohol dehydrogenase family)